MGKRGPKPEPTAVLKMKGSWRADTRSGEPVPPSCERDAPESLGEHGRAVWLELEPLLRSIRVLTTADYREFETYCRAWDWLEEAEADVKEHGSMILTEKGAVVSNPAHVRRVKAVQLIRQLGADFGLNPSARTAIKVSPVTGDDDLGSLGQTG